MFEIRKRLTEKLTDLEGKKSELAMNEKEITQSIKRVEDEKNEREENFSEQAKYVFFLLLHYVIENGVFSLKIVNFYHIIY